MVHEMVGVAHRSAADGVRLWWVGGKSATRSRRGPATPPAKRWVPLSLREGHGPSTPTGITATPSGR